MDPLPRKWIASGLQGLAIGMHIFPNQLHHFVCRFMAAKNITCSFLLWVSMLTSSYMSSIITSHEQMNWNLLIFCLLEWELEGLLFFLHVQVPMQEWILCLSIGDSSRTTCSQSTGSKFGCESHSLPRSMCFSGLKWPHTHQSLEEPFGRLQYDWHCCTFCRCIASSWGNYSTYHCLLLWSSQQLLFNGSMAST